MAAEPAPGELEQFFRLDAKTLESARAKRRATTPRAGLCSGHCADARHLPDGRAGLGPGLLGAQPGRVSASVSRRTVS